MKKFLLSLACVVSAFAASAATITDEITVESLKSHSNYNSTSTGYTTFQVTGNSGAVYDLQCAHNGGTCLQFRSKNSNSGLVTTKSPGKVTKVEITWESTTASGRTVNVYGYETLISNPEGLYNNSGITATKLEYPSDKTATVDNTTYVGLRSNSGALYLSKIAITWEVSGNVVAKDNAELSFPEKSYTVKQGEEFTAPSLSKATDAAPVYTSSEESVATVNASTGAVTIVGKGTTVITATCNETDDFYEGSAKYTLVVLDVNTFWVANCKDKTNPDFTFETLSGDFQPWSIDTTYGLKGSAFASSKANASDAVAASPVLDFTGCEAPMSLEYHHAVNQFKVNGGSMIECTDESLGQYVSIVAKEEGATEWTKIGTVSAPAAGFSWTYVDATPVNLSAFAGKKVQLGFRYVSTEECAGTWEIDEVVVIAKKSADAVESIVVDENAPVEYYNLQGVRVANPTNGLYIVRQGNKVSKQLVK